MSAHAVGPSTLHCAHTERVDQENEPPPGVVRHVLTLAISINAAAVFLPHCICIYVHHVQIVWSDQDEEPPPLDFVNPCSRSLIHITMPYPNTALCTHRLCGATRTMSRRRSTSSAPVRAHSFTLSGTQRTASTTASACWRSHQRMVFSRLMTTCSLTART